MALYAIGDLHLSLTAHKPMEVFGPAWENHVSRVEAALGALTGEDVLILAGDTSWGIDLDQAEADFRFLDQFPCKKYLIKGNHDYWWSTVSKMKAFFAEKASPPWTFSTTTAPSTAATPSAAPGAGFWRRTRSPTTPRS